MIPRYHELRAAGRRPRVHGNGFLQLDLNDDGTKRLHVWDEGLPRQGQRSSVHDHVFALRSTVICGVLEHIEYDAEPGDDFEIWRAQRLEGTQNTVLGPTGELVRLVERRRLILASGNTYDFPALELHDTEHRGLTATIMEKVGAPADYGNPRVLVPVGAKADNDFDREGFAEALLWPYVKRALRQARWEAM